MDGLDSYVRTDIECEGANVDKPLVWLGAEIKTPPLSARARVEVGVQLRRLQHGESLGMPHSRPMPAIGRNAVIQPRTA